MFSGCFVARGRFYDYADVMDELRIHQLTKEMVAAELKLSADPCEAAAGVVRKILGPALLNPPAGTPPGLIVEDVVRGAMIALLLADQNLARGAMGVLDAVLETAGQAQLDPTEAMRAALQGAADLGRFTDPARLNDIRVAIDGKFMGAGEVFSGFLRATLPAPGRIPSAR